MAEDKGVQLVSAPSRWLQNSKEAPFPHMADDLWGDAGLLLLLRSDSTNRLHQKVKHGEQAPTLFTVEVAFKLPCLGHGKVFVRRSGLPWSVAQVTMSGLPAMAATVIVLAD